MSITYVKSGKTVKVLSGPHKGVSTNKWERRDKTFEIHTSKGFILVHESRCEVV